MLWNVAVFALVGLLAGGAARLFYPGRQPRKIALTMAVGAAGSVLGGLLSWAFWTATPGEVSNSALVVSLLGAVVMLLVWAGVAHARSVAGPPDPAS
jgi:uncharacterized membrane protein YeaQ/YmgE (transglycosylase-associated protein family)